MQPAILPEQLQELCEVVAVPAALVFDALALGPALLPDELEELYYKSLLVAAALVAQAKRCRWPTFVLQA